MHGTFAKYFCHPGLDPGSRLNIGKMREMDYNVLMLNINLITRPWHDYELLDSGDNRKLERYGSVLLIRPETQVLWRPSRPELWAQAVAEFSWADGKGAWKKRGHVPESWELSWENAGFTIRLTPFKHTGVFPEQAANWEWLNEKIAKLHKPNVLNLFAYTGIASIVAAKQGARVTHVDASRQSNLWAKANAHLSEVGADRIRYVLDDAVKFAEREVRRGSMYDGVILDPPAFGRGPKGEVWHIEEQLPRLMDALAKIFSEKPGSFFLLNGYAAGYSPTAFLRATKSAFPESALKNKFEFGELQIQESGSERVLPQGIYVRFAR